MRYMLSVPGLEGRVEVVTSSWTAGSHLLLDGKPATKGRGRSEYVLPRPDGSQCLVRFTGQRLDLVPKVTVDDVPQTLAPPLSPGEWIVTAMPLVLMIVGGAVGGVCAAFGIMANAAIMRSGLPALGKYLSAIGVTLAAFAFYFVIAVTLFHAWHQGGIVPSSVGSPQPGLPSGGSSPPNFPAPPNIPAPTGFPGAPRHP